MGGGTLKLLPKKSQLRSPAPSLASQAGLGTRPRLCGLERTHPEGLLRAAGIAQPPSAPRTASPAALPPSSQKRGLGVGGQRLSWRRPLWRDQQTLWLPPALPSQVREVDTDNHPGVQAAQEKGQVQDCPTARWLRSPKGMVWSDQTTAHLT